MGAFAEWISGKVFTAVHGNNLVYNTCWEDPRLDKVALELTPEDNLLVITSAGCNALSYAIEGLNRVYAVDMNYRQNAVLELKIAGLKSWITKRSSNFSAKAAFRAFVKFIATNSARTCRNRRKNIGTKTLKSSSTAKRSPIISAALPVIWRSGSTASSISAGCVLKSTR